MVSTVVSVEDVLVVRRTAFGWFCEIGDDLLFLGSLQIAPGTSMPGDGERGRVTLTMDAARDLGLARAA